MMLKIAIASTRKAAKWNNTEISWADLLTKLSEVKRTSETAKEYSEMTKQQRDEIKDVGGFVGGHLLNGKRKKGCCDIRSVITLDADSTSEDLLMELDLRDYQWAVYSTHSHTAKKPRYRVIIPLEREVTNAEYTPLAMKVAEDLGINNFDPTTYQVERLMYWPSCSSDAEFIFQQSEGADQPLNPDEVLSQYKDWRDASEWPDVGVNYRAKSEKKQGDPLGKPGVIGAFNRAYTISETISKFLQDYYTSGDMPNRYTYKNAETANGLVVYDSDIFAYSNHASDPASGRLLNAFDLVRLHKFGELDEKTVEDTPITKLKSVKAMREWAAKLDEVKEELMKERLQIAKQEFGVVVEEKENTDWYKQLRFEKSGEPRVNSKNLQLIMENDPKLCETVGLNDFAHRVTLLKDLPWRKKSDGDYWTDYDEANLRIYIENKYGLAHTGKTKDVLDSAIYKGRFHPVRDYLASLEWDGETRIDSLLIDTLGAEDNQYTRTITRKFLIAAVARIFEPGVKFDSVLLLIGPQGIGKSLLGAKLGGRWFSDSIYTIEGKDAMEQIQGNWIIEMAEMIPTRKAEVEAVKQFISKQEDRFREAYGRNTNIYSRQCVFIGTTNNSQILQDSTGNRRFWPVECTADAEKRVWELTGDDIAQIWAEAVVAYNKGESLYLSEEDVKIAAEVQKSHTAEDPRKGVIVEYLDTLLPEDWDDLAADVRNEFLTYNNENKIEGTVQRKYVCAAEIWVECLGKRLSDMKKYDSRQIYAMLDELPEWERIKRPGFKLKFKQYGIQIAYERVSE